jgi:hypothetical protein
MEFDSINFRSKLLTNGTKYVTGEELMLEGQEPVDKITFSKHK